jgi:hypothetical protein
LQSAGSSGEVGAGAINGQNAALYTTAQFDLIKPEVISSDLTLLTDISLLYLQFANTNISTTFTDAESVESIRVNAPSTFKTQFRTVTTSDYEIFVKNNFANIINDVKAFNNNTYTNEHLRYLYDIGLTNPGQDYRVLYNQMSFADACNFNNVYVYVLPKATKLITNNYVNYLTPAQKQLIISTLNDKKTLTSEVIVMDPVYKAVTIGLGKDAVDLSDIASSRLRVILLRNAKVPASVVKSQIQNILQTYFNPIDITLGFTVSVTDIASDILALNGVKEVQTVNDTEVVNGVSFIVYNPSYPQNDIISTTKNFTVQLFQTVYLDNIDEIMTRVEVVPEVNQDTSIINF